MSPEHTPDAGRLAVTTERPRGAGRLSVATAAALAIIALLGLYSLRLAFDQVLAGTDGHAYWSAWANGELYAGSSIYSGTYVYPPPMAQLIYPLTLLPWEAFRLLTATIAAAAFLWLLWPLSVPFRIVSFAAIVPGLLVGNIEWLIALAIVVGMRRPAAWAIPAIAKVTPGVGALWFPFRREWRSFAIAVGAGLAVVAVSFALDPAAWARWVDVARSATVLPEHAWLPNQWLPLPLRLVAAVALVAMAARRGQPYLLPVAIILATPDLNPPTFAILAAVPRLVEPRP